MAIFNLFDFLLAGFVVFLGGMIFGYWVTNSDPAFFLILMRSEKFKARYDAAKQQTPSVEIRSMLNIRKVVKPWQETGSLNANLNLYGFVADDMFLTNQATLA